MPTIPSVANIKRYIPQGQKPVAVEQNVGAVGQAVTGLGQAVMRVGEAYDARAKFDATNATIEYENELLGLDNEFESRPFDDKDTVDSLAKSYQEKAFALRDKYAEKLGSGTAKEYFGLLSTQRANARVQRARGVAINKQQAWGKQKLINGLESLVQYRSSDPNPEVVFGMAADLITAASDPATGFIANDAEAQALESDFKQKFIEQRVTGMSPEQQIEFTKTDLFRQLPDAQRATIEKRAIEQGREATSLRTVDDFFRNKTPANQRAAKIDEIAQADPILAERIRVDYAQRVQRAEAEQTRAADNLYEQLVPRFLDPDPTKRLSMRDLSPAQRQQLGKSLISLGSIEKGMAETNTAFGKHTDPGVTETALTLVKKRDWIGLRAFMHDTPTEKFSETDFEKYMKIGIDGGAAGDVKPWADAKDVFTQTMKQANIKPTDKRYAVLDSAFGQWFDNQTQLTGKPPSDADARKELSRLQTERVVEERPLWFDKTATQADVEYGETGWNTVKSTSPAAAAAIEKKYPNMSAADKMRIFRNEWMVRK